MRDTWWYQIDKQVIDKQVIDKVILMRWNLLEKEFMILLFTSLHILTITYFLYAAVCANSYVSFYLFQHCR